VDQICHTGPGFYLIQLFAMVVHEKILVPKPKIPARVSQILLEEQPDPMETQDQLLDRWPLAKLMKKESYLKRSVS